MSVRRTLDDLRDDAAWTPETALGLLVDWLDSHAPPFARRECERFLRSASDPDSGSFRPAGGQARRAAKGLVQRASGLVAAQRLDLSGLGPEDLERLMIVVRHLESRATSERSKRKRGDFWT